jgi:hypothetical protein
VLHAAFENVHAVHLVVDFYDGLDLFSLISARGRLPEPAGITAKLAFEIVVFHCHGVVHRTVGRRRCNAPEAEMQGTSGKEQGRQPWRIRNIW